ncbi:MAG: ABC transporter permease [Pseudomonadota bacterium]
MNRATFIMNGFRRHTARTILTLASLMIAFLLFMLIRAISAGLAGGVTTGGVERLVVDARYSMTDNLPMTHIRAISELPGVADVTPMVWFGGYYKDPQTTFTTLPVDPEGYFNVFPDADVDPLSYTRFLASKQAVLVHETLVEKHAWKVGQVIPLMGDIWPKEDGSWDWEFVLAGSYRTAEGSRIPKAFLLRYDYFNDSVVEWVKDQAGWAVVSLVQGQDAQAVIDSIDSLFENSSDPTKSMTEDAYGQEMANEVGDISLIAMAILGAVFFTLVLLTNNVVSLSFHERVAEFATMKSLGFHDSAVAAMVMFETLLLCLFGAALGIVAGFLLEPHVQTSLAMVLGFFKMTWMHAIQALAIATCLGIVVGTLPALRARRLSIAQALRKVNG